MLKMNPYLGFNGEASEALAYYKGVFGGELRITTFSEFGGGPPGADDLVMHGQLDAANFTLMADDDPEGTASLAMEAVNATICAAAEDAGMGFVDLDHAFAKAGGASGLVSNDGLHPDAEGVRVIGEAFAAATP